MCHRTCLSGLSTIFHEIYDRLKIFPRPLPTLTGVYAIYSIFYMINSYLRRFSSVAFLGKSTLNLEHQLWEINSDTHPLLSEE